MRMLTFMLALFALWSMIASGQIAKQKIAILPFENNTKYPQLSSYAVADLSDYFHKSNKFDIVERANLEEIMKEQALSMTGAIEATSIQAGKILGVEYVIMGSVIDAYVGLTKREYLGDIIANANAKEGQQKSVQEGYDSYAQLTIKIINTTTAEVMFTKTAKGKSEPALVPNNNPNSALNKAIDDAVKNITEGLLEKWPINSYIIAVHDTTEYKTGKTTKDTSFTIVQKTPTEMINYRLSANKDTLLNIDNPYVEKPKVVTKTKGKKKVKEESAPVEIEKMSFTIFSSSDTTTLVTDIIKDNVISLNVKREKDSLLLTLRTKADSQQTRLAIVSKPIISKTYTKTVTLDVGANWGVKRGQKFVVIFQEPPIEHPVTKGLIPGKKHVVAELTLDTVDEYITEARVSKLMIDTLKTLKVGMMAKLKVN